MSHTRATLLLMLFWTAVAPADVRAGGLISDRVNKVRLEGRFGDAEPRFILVFSAEPWRDEGGRPLNGLPDADVAKLPSAGDMAIVPVHGKRVSNKGVVEYFFGPKEDGQQPWNDGRTMKWEEWENRSPDIWDHLAVIYDGPVARKGPSAVLLNIAVVKGGKTLYDSAARESYPNRRRIDPAFPGVELAPKQGRRPVLNLADRMAKFRRDYYELGDNRILLTAYADLCQTDKNKYARRGKNWCTEFASHVYRENGLLTPDPNRSDVHWKNMREFFQEHGNVYPLREVAAWPDQKKQTLIKPGSFVSILIGDSTHSLIFTTWVVEKGKPVTQYVGVSGNNKGMVWPHAPLKLPTAADLQGKSAEELRDFDQKVYVAVPAD